MTHFPHIVQTLSVYATIAEHIEREMDLSPQGLEQAVIGTMKGIDTPVRPGQAVSSTLARHLRGSSPERRQAFREALLGLQPQTVRDAAAILREALVAAPVCVLSSRAKLESANANLEQPLAISDL